MELNTEIIQQAAGIYVARDVCVGLVLLFAFLFIVFSFVAARQMAKKKTRRTQGLSQLFTSLAVASLMGAAAPAVAIPVLGIQIDHVEQSWGYDQVDAFEEECEAKVPKRDREKVANQFVEALSAEGELREDGTRKLGTVVVDSAFPSAFEPRHEDGKSYYTVDVVEENGLAGTVARPSELVLRAEIEENLSRGV